MKKISVKKQIKIALSGDRGRMGQSLKKLIKQTPLKQVSAVANSQKSFQLWEAKEIDVVIDFSLPLHFEKVLAWCVANKKALVSGTTGLSPTQKRKLTVASKKIPIFYAENMSWGIFCLSHFLSSLSGEVRSLQIEDIHHKDKKDKPSGTALRLKNSFSKKLQSKVKIKSYRKGKELGLHKIVITLAREKIILEHQCLSRDLFAEGALKASEFVSSKKKGLYSLQDIYLEKNT